MKISCGKTNQTRIEMNKYYRKTAIHFGFWLLVFGIQYFLIINLKSIEESLQRSLINTTFYAVIYYYTRYVIFKFYENEKTQAWLKRQLILIVASGITRGLIEIYYLKTNIFSDVIHPNQSALYIISGLILYVFMAAFISFFISFYFISKKRRKVEAKNKQLKLENLENQLLMLNNQLSPHFLFNSLNDIYAAIVLGQDIAGEMILKLSEIMRYITYETHKERILFSDEIKQVEYYLHFYFMRANAPLKHVFTYDHSIGDAVVIPMLLIPLVENALKHGNFNDPEIDSYLNIELNQKENLFCLRIENTFEKNVQKKENRGIGLINYQRRLELKYPNKFQFEQYIENGVYISQLALELN